ncbi:hypothetical protein V8C42DRAFT_309441 [Trichoderma barbatum]
MGSTSQSSKSGPPLETLSIKQLMRLHCGDKLWVHPVQWTSRHLEVLQCSFDESPPPLPSQQHMDELDKLLAAESCNGAAKKIYNDSAKKLFASDLWRVREACLRYIIGSDGCPLVPFMTIQTIRFFYGGRLVSSLPCQSYASRHGNKAASGVGMAPIALVSIDCQHIKQLRYEQMLYTRGRRFSIQTDELHQRHVRRLTPSNRLRDPYLVALLLAVANHQRERTISSIWTRASFWPQVAMTDHEDECIHLFAAHISSNYLNKFDFPSRRPAKSAQQPLVIHHIPIQIQPHDTLRHRLLQILFHPADYYNGGELIDEGARWANALKLL